MPDSRTCRDGELLHCRADGAGYDVEQTCEAGEQCTLNGCADLCRDAEETRSYIGCDYWPVTTANASLDWAFEPAVAVGNPNLEDAHVTVARAGVSMDVRVPAGSIEVVALPFVETLKEPFALTRDGDAPALALDLAEPRSALVRGGGYHLTSDVPVTVHQFNPLEFETDTCVDLDKQDSERGCFAYTNDASLLLPTSALTGNYVVMSRPTLPIGATADDGYTQQRPGFVAIVATQDEPTEVVIRASAHVAPSSSRSDLDLPALAPGETLTVELEAGDVLQLASAAVDGECPGKEAVGTIREGMKVCDAGESYDLTGTEIEADAPVSVIAGHDCSYVPFDRGACDHLEESMWPVESWGTQMVVTRTVPAYVDALRVKVLSASDGNRITVDPLDTDIVLDRGESYEFQTRRNLLVSGSAPLTVAQFMVGQGKDESGRGDPSMSMAVPTDQFKREYVILTPETYDDVYVDLITRGGVVRLNGREVGGLAKVGDSEFSVVRQSISAAGLHRIEGATEVGVVVYGIAPYTSYMAPGGLDLQLLHPPPF